MADESMPMIVATSALRQRRYRVGEVMGVSLPRSVDLLTLGIVVGFALVGVIIGAGIIGGFTAIIWSVTISGSLGYIAATYQPVKGVSIYKWLRLRLGLRRRSQLTDDAGKPIAAYVGIAHIQEWIPNEPIYLLPGAVEVNESNYHLVGLTTSRRWFDGDQPVPLRGGLEYRP